MSAIRPSLRRSARLQANAKSPMARPATSKGKGKALPATWDSSPALKLKNKTTVLTNQGATSTATSTKNQTIDAHTTGPEAVTPANEPITWECHPHLTENLISWLLSHPADHVILFYDKKDCIAQGGTGTQSKPSGNMKKLVQAAIAKKLFENDPIYGALYASHQDKFAVAVQSRLATLKGKYRTQSDKLKSTGAGINPGDHQNLIQQIRATFPYFDDCDTMWRGNPSYDSQLFNSSPSADRSGDFLSLIQRGSGDTSAVASANAQPPTIPDRPPVDSMHDGQVNAESEEQQMDDWDVNPNTGEFTSGGNVAMQEEDNNNEDNGGGGDEMDVDKELDGGTNRGSHVGQVAQGGSSNHQHEIPLGEMDNDAFSFASFQKPQRPPKPRTPSWDGRAAFWATPYPTRPPSTISSVTPPSAYSDPVSRSKCAGTPMSQSSLPSSTKGKGTTLDQFKSSIKDTQDVKVSTSILKNERYHAKMNFHMREREILHLEAERTQARAEAEELHRHELEMKKTKIELRKVDVEVLDKESEILPLKIRLAECNKSPLSAGAPSGNTID
ncbi:hypothetical protein BU15DRAFT_82987 [Melanogaster broomeanus]|nr:hypothetical protein BU15DRAFT_82987 [Melanogaster broomeanus]